MLQSINDKAQGWIAWTIIGLVSFTFVLWGIQDFLSSGHFSDTVAKVNGTKITQPEFQRAYQRLRMQAQSQLGPNFILNSNLQTALKTQAMKQLVQNTVLEQAAHSAGFAVSLAQAEALVSTIPAFNQNGKFSQDLFQQYLSVAQQSPESFVMGLVSQLTINQVQAGIVATAITTPYDLQQMQTLLFQTRDVSYLTIPSTLFAKQVSVTDQDVKAYYEKHTQDFMNPATVKLDYLVISLSDLIKQQTVTDQQVKDYYQNNLDNYRTQPQWQVAHILIKLAPNATAKEISAAQNKADDIEAKLKQGQDFTSLAKTSSDDAISANQGGVINAWIKPGQVDPSFMNALMKLTTVSQISPPTRTQYGIDIIKLLAIKPAVQEPLDTVKDAITQTLKANAAEKIFGQQSDVLTNLSFENPNTLAPAAKALHMQIQTTPYFTQASATTAAPPSPDDLTKNPKIISAAFSDDLQKQGNNSDLIQLDQNRVAVIRVADAKPKSEKPLTEVAATIKTLLLNQAMEAQAQKLGQTIITALEKGSSSQSTLDQYHLTWQTAKNITRMAGKPSPYIVTNSFALPEPSKAVAKPMTSFNDGHQNYVILQLDAVNTAAAKDLSPDQKSTLEKQIMQSLGFADYQMYVESKKAKAKIDVNKPAADMTVS